MGEQTIDVAASIRLWPVKGLREHPDNPRRVNTKSEKFRDLVASIEANGIVEPLTVRSDPGLDSTIREVLSGHRRLAAARELGLKEVPVRDLGDVSDDLAYDIVAMANLHEDLTPLEEGKRAAVWLDKYNQDVAAVASKLGKAASWVVQHAQIARGLSAEWQAAATQLEMLDRWTASHWAVIARLPAALQARELAKFKSGAYCSYDRWTVKALEDRIKIETLYLAKAPFDVAVCEGCIDRTDRQPLLWGEVAKEATGDMARCLNRKCWEKKAAAYAEKELKEVAADKGVPDAVPLSLLERPKSWPDSARYDDRIRELKKQYGPKLLTADRVKVVPEGTKDAIAAIAVAGVRGKGAMGVRWVKPKKEPATGGRGRGGSKPSPEQEAKEAERVKKLRQKMQAAEIVFDQLASLAQPEDVTVLYCCAWTGDWPDGFVGEKSEKAIRKAWRSDRDACRDQILTALWVSLLHRWKNEYVTEYSIEADWQECVEMGEVFAIDATAVLKRIEEEEEEGATEDTETTEKPCKKRASGAARRKKAKKGKKS